MIKQNAVACMKTISFAIVNSYPVSIKLGTSVWTPGIERSILCLRNLSDKAVQFGCTCLINTYLILHIKKPHCFQDTQSTYSICIRSVFGYIEAYFDMRHCTQIVYFIGAAL